MKNSIDTEVLIKQINFVASCRRLGATTTKLDISKDTIKIDFKDLYNYLFNNKKDTTYLIIISIVLNH